MSLLERLRNAGDYLADILNHLMADRRGDAPAGGQLRLSMVDGSTVSLPSSDRSDWRLHARYEPARGCFTDLVITEAQTAEALCCVSVRPGDVLVQDRGYARVRNFAHARMNGADFITRIGWRSVRLFDIKGHGFDLLTVLPDSTAAVVEHPVFVGDGRKRVAARLIIARKPPEAVERQHRRLYRKASRNGSQTDPRTLRTAGFMMMLTSLSAEQATAEQVVRLYRMRWQVELAFKRLKSLGGFAKLHASDSRLARTWLLAHLIATRPDRDFAGRRSRLSPLSHTPANGAWRASGGAGKEDTDGCNAHSSPEHASGKAAPPAHAPQGASPNHQENANPNPKARNLPYPSAYEARPLALL
ncbi:transposase [Lichenicoccus sp.]|uniref:transposase n=1 Tax=Lichenicoccus sp. TaxID=2781899 RepID=UPI003D0F304A